MATNKTVKNAVAWLKIVNQSNGLIRPLMNHLTHFPISLRSLIVTVKLQTIRPHSFFQREETMLLNLIKMMSQLYQPMLQREHPPTYLLLIWIMLLLSLIMLQLPNPTILMNVILNIYAKASKSRNANLAIYIELTKLCVLLDLSRFQFTPPDSSIRN